MLCGFHKSLSLCQKQVLDRDASPFRFDGELLVEDIDSRC